MKLDKQLINNIREKISIVDVINSYIKLLKKGKNYVGLCPFHDDKHASLTVTDDKKIFKCFSCNASGDVFGFISKYKNLSYYQSVIEASKIANIDNHLISRLLNFSEQDVKNNSFYTINQFAYFFFHKFLKNKENAYAMNYLKSRNINTEDIEYFKIGYAPDDSNILLDLLTDKNGISSGQCKFKYHELLAAGLAHQLKNSDFISFFQNRIIFSILDENNNIVGFSGRSLSDDTPKYLNTSSTEIFNKNELLYNLNNVIKDIEIETLYVVEGFMDVIALTKLGIKNVVAPMGVSFSKNHLETLSRLSNLKVINLCFDNDTAGKISTQKAVEIIKLKYDVYIVDYLDDAKDIDELMQKNTELAKKTVNNLVDYESYLINLILTTSNIENEANKKIVLDKCIAILKKNTNVLSIDNNIKKISKYLNINENLILNVINFNNSVYLKKDRNIRNKKNFNSDNIDIKTGEKQKIQNIVDTSLTEIEILKCCLFNRTSVEYFVDHSNVFLNSDYRNIFILIDDFYTNNIDLNRIEEKNLKNIFANNSTYLNLVTQWIKELYDWTYEKNAVAIVQTIDTHIKKYSNKLRKDIEEKIKNGNFSMEDINKIIKMNQRKIKS